MSQTIPLADFSPTLSAEVMGAFGSLFFGAPLTIVVLLLARRRVVRFGCTPGGAWRLGFLTGGIVSILIVTIIFSIVWANNLGSAGWTVYLENYIGGCVCMSTFACFSGGLFGSILCYAGHPGLKEVSIVPTNPNRDEPTT